MAHEDYVREGIQWMQENHPGKLRTVVLPELHMSLYSCCIIGQTLGAAEYHRLEEEYGLDWMVSHGFDAEGQRDYFGLGGAWKDALRELFA